MIKKTIEIAETVIPAKTIELVPQDLTVFFEAGEVVGIRMSLSEGQRIEIKPADKRWTEELATAIEDICQTIVDTDSDEKVAIDAKAYDSVMQDAKKKAFDKAVADGEIDENGFPIEAK